MKRKRDDSATKLEVGERFRIFRESLGKAQHELAAELHVSQSTIANIERGKAFPNISYLHHFYRFYRLNIHWMLLEQGEMLTKTHPRGEKYEDLFNTMQVPIVEELIFAKFIETKAMLKEQIDEYWAAEKKEKEKEENKEEKAAG